MNVLIRTVLILTVAVLSPSVSPCQGPPGKKLSVDIRVPSVTMRGDTVTVEYVLYTHPSSAERLIFFTVDAPLEVLAINLPEPSEAWSNGTTYGERPVATWAALDRIAQGSSSPPLSFRARGLPGIVKAWYRGDRLPTLGEDGSEGVEPDPSLPVPPPPPNPDPLTDLSVETRTVGVDPIFSDATAASLTARLDSLTAQSCALGWITQASLCITLRGHLTAQPSRLPSFQSDLAAGHTPGGPVADNAYWLLKVNADYIMSLNPPTATSTAIFLAGSGATANPPTLSLSATAPTATTAKYKDSPGIAFSGGNPWVEVGTWRASPALSSGTLAALGNAQGWLGLKNSDDIGTNYDVRTEIYKNGTLVASGQTLCIQGITRNPNLARQISVVFGTLSPSVFNGATDVLSLKVSTRIGTTTAGAFCGGHSNAVGLRLYFDALNRAAKFDATF